MKGQDREDDAVHCSCDRVGSDGPGKPSSPRPGKATPFNPFTDHETDHAGRSNEPNAGVDQVGRGPGGRDQDRHSPAGQRDIKPIPDAQIQTD